MHGWGSDFMIAIVLIHMAQVFLFGAYKFPRELTWIVGVFLLLLTLGMAFTGQVLRFDQDAYWGLGIGASILSRVPFIGGRLVDMMLGGPIIAGPTLTRFFALHVFVIPGMLLVDGRSASLDGSAAWHQRLADARASGSKEHLCPRVSRTHKEDRDSLSYLTLHGRTPSSRLRSCLLSSPARSSSARLVPLGSRIRRSLKQCPKPDFAFLWIYAVLAYLPPSLETPVTASSRLSWLSERCCFFRWSRARERNIGRAVR